MTLSPGIRRVMRPRAPAARRVSQRPRRILTLREQSARITLTWPSLRCRINGRGRRAQLVCHGHLRPSTITRDYRIAVQYSIGEPPVALVEQPELIARADQPRIPHTYGPENGLPRRPCLYYPPDGDWAPDRSLAFTIVPWLVQWLMHYEAWFVTGVWSGGGVEHDPIVCDTTDAIAVAQGDAKTSR